MTANALPCPNSGGFRNLYCLMHNNRYSIRYFFMAMSQKTFSILFDFSKNKVSLLKVPMTRKFLLFYLKEHEK